MKSAVLFVLIITIFTLSFVDHHAVLMYPLSALIFYVYLPKIYAFSRINIFHHLKANEFIHLKYYPMEFFLWLLATCFFSFILAHLTADLLYRYSKHIHYFMYPVIFIDLGFIVYREVRAKNLLTEQLQSYYERQGRLLTFEILFIFLLLFMIPH